MPRRPPAQSAGLGIEDELSFGSDEDLLADVGEINVGPSPAGAGAGAGPVPPLPHTQSKPLVSAAEVKVQKPRNSMLGGLKSLGGNKKDGRRTTAGSAIDPMRTSMSDNNVPSRSSLNLMASSRERREKKDNKSLAGAALVLEPHLESVLDLSTNASHYNIAGSAASKAGGSTPSLGSGSVGYSAGANGSKKKAGLMGAFKGLRSTKKEDPVRVFAGSSAAGVNRIHPDDSRDSFGSRNSALSRQQSFDYSGFSNSPHTNSSDTSSAQHRHALAPIATSPFKAQPLDLPSDPAPRSVSSTSKHTDTSSLARRTSTAGSTATGTSGGMPSSRGTFGGKWTPLDDRSIDRRSSIISSERAMRPSLHSSISTSSSSIAPPSPLTPSLGAITTVLLPSFPATLSSLESIQILSATVIKRTFTNSGMPDKEKSNSLRSLAGMLPSSTTSTIMSSPKKPLWVTQQLVLTSFKVGGSTPNATPDPSDFNSRHRSSQNSSRTIAHLHLFNVTGSTVKGHTKSPSRTGNGNSIGLSIGSSQTFATRHIGNSVNEEMSEVERRVVTANSTAGVWDDGDGRRKFVMRIMFGDPVECEDDEVEWIAEMRNAEQLHEWIRQIKSVAVVIRAEREGHGRVIGDAYKNGTFEADDLALELNMERGAASVRSPTTASTDSGSRITSRDITSDFPALEEKEESRPAGMERNPSAARTESPDLLGPDPTFVVNNEDEDEADKLARQLLDFEIASITRQKSFDEQSSLLGAFPLAPHSGGIDRAVRPASSAYPPSLGQDLELDPTDSPRRHQGVSNDTLAPLAASSISAKRMGVLRSAPPPPLTAPPTMPLPAIPTNELQVTIDDNTAPSSATSSSVSKIDEEEIYHPPSPRVNNEPRLSLPSLEPIVSMPDRELELLRARQHNRAASLPGDDGSAKLAAARIRKERLALAFKPIPLAPEVTHSQSPVLSQYSSGGNTPRSAGSPLLQQIMHGQNAQEEEEGGTKTPGASNLHISQLPPPLGLNLDDKGRTGIDTPEFFTPTMEQEQGLDPMDNVPSSYRYTDELELDRLRLGTEKRPLNKRYSSADTASILSIPSISSRASTSASSSRRRRGIKPVAVDIMSEFNESPDAQYREEGEEAIKEDRPRVIRFAEN